MDLNCYSFRSQDDMLNVKKIKITSTIILSVSIIISSIIISYAIISCKKSEGKTEIKNELLTDEDVAKYINMPINDFKKMMDEENYDKQLIVRSYDHYEFMPYVKIQGKRYYKKEYVDKWLDYGIEHNRNIK